MCTPEPFPAGNLKVRPDRVIAAGARGRGLTKRPA